MHGVSLNVDMDLSPFQEITPCGLQGCHATSMAKVVDQPVSLLSVTHSLLDQLKQTLAIEWTGAPAPVEFHTVA